MADENTTGLRRVDMMIIAMTILTVIAMSFLFLWQSGRISQDVEQNYLFSFRSGSVILIDSDMNFKASERITAQDNLLIVLRQGVYYWKIEDAIPEDVILLNITEKSIGLKLRKSSEGYDVVNFNNASLNVDIYREGGLTGRVIVGEYEDNMVSKVVYVGGENEG